jgi:hypothetical protein
MTSGKRPTGETLKPVARSTDRNRACPVCGDRLSSYNPGPHCYNHTVSVPWKGPASPR